MPSSLSAALLLLVAVVGSLAAASAADLAPRRAAYKEINAKVDTFEKVTATTTFDGGKVRLTGWVDAGRIRKVVAQPGRSGNGTDEYYFDDEGVLFVFRSYALPKTKENSARPVEERIYLRNGDIVEWLVDRDAFGQLHAEDYASEAAAVKKATAAFTRALATAMPKAKKEASPKGAQTLDGTFLGIEQGDYPHWNMRTGEGKAVSFFMLKSSLALDAVFNDPDKFRGRRCRVTWKRSRERLAEAAQTLEIDQILDVEWLTGGR